MSFSDSLKSAAPPNKSPVVQWLLYKEANTLSIQKHILTLPLEDDPSDTFSSYLRWWSLYTWLPVLTVTMPAHGHFGLHGHQTIALIMFIFAPYCFQSNLKF